MIEIAILIWRSESLKSVSEVANVGLILWCPSPCSSSSLFHRLTEVGHSGWASPPSVYDKSRLRLDLGNLERCQNICSLSVIKDLTFRQTSGLLSDVDSSKERMEHFGRFRSPTPDEPGYEAFMEFMRSIETPELKEDSRRRKEFALSILNAQRKNSVGFVINKEIRFFLLEYNNRTWQHGFGAMPSSFNVLEAFFRWRPKAFFFELHEEEDYLFSTLDFLDFLTSNKCTQSLPYCMQSTVEKLIYSYSAINDIKKLTLQAEEKEFVLSGVSFIRHRAELSLFAVGAQVISIEESGISLADEELPTDRHRAFIKPDDNLKHERVFLNCDPELWQLLIYLRVDLSTGTITSRYIQIDEGDRFTTYTDDTGMLKQSLPKEETFQEIMKTQLAALKDYEPLFDFVYNCIFLPEYFDHNESVLVNQLHPTELAQESTRDATLAEDYALLEKEVWVIDKRVQVVNGQIRVPDPGLKMETSGYWRYLQPGDIGRDRNNNPIHGRTWVEETVSWFFTDRPAIDSYATKKTDKSGYIYLMRNAAHDIDVFKIGLTTKAPEVRARQLSGTGSPDRYLIAQSWFTVDCFLAERLIHERLKDKRINPSREFFQLPLQAAIKVILPIINKINAGYS